MAYRRSKSGGMISGAKKERKREREREREFEGEGDRERTIEACGCVNATRTNGLLYRI
jgi:hypothetical protein